MIHDTQSVHQISQKQDVCNIHAIMKTMCPPGYDHSGFEAIHALRHKILGTCARVNELPQSRCGNNRDGTLFP